MAETKSVLGVVRSTVWALLLACCVSCGASTNVESVRDPNYSKQMRSLYVLIDGADIDQDFSNALEETFVRELKRRGTTTTKRPLTT